MREVEGPMMRGAAGGSTPSDLAGLALAVVWLGRAFRESFLESHISNYSFIVTMELTLPSWLLRGEKRGWNDAPFRPLPYRGAEHACFGLDDSLRKERKDFESFSKSKCPLRQNFVQC